MKNIVLKVPTSIFIVLVLLPILIFALQIVSGEELIKPEYYDVLSIVGSFVTWIWLFSIVDYFHSKAPGFKHIRWVYLLLFIDFTLVLLDHFYFTGLNLKDDILVFIIRSVLFIAALVFITILIRSVFYERAVWFIVLELLIMIVGITTLTPEIKRHEKELEGLI